MLTAFLKEIQLAYPKARLTLLGPAKAKTLLEGSPMLTSLWCFNKKHFVGDDGWFQTLKRLKRHKFELIIDASNPTSPSTTQTILSLLGNAPHKLGFGNESAKSAYTLTAQPLSADEHENLQRVQLLTALGYSPSSPQLPDLSHLTKVPQPKIENWLASEGIRSFIVLNIGARLKEKQLDSNDYREIIDTITGLERDVVLTFGPSELDLAEKARQGTSARLAPRTNLLELAALFHRADSVVTCDTGPMHLAVALNTPTCGIFVSTSPQRYGYQTDRHTSFDARQGLKDDIKRALPDWVTSTRTKA